MYEFSGKEDFKKKARTRRRAENEYSKPHCGQKKRQPTDGKSLITRE
jgi:hypothetical protein